MMLKMLENFFLKLSASYKIRTMPCSTFASLSSFYSVLLSSSLVVFPKLEACDDYLLL